MKKNSKLPLSDRLTHRVDDTHITLVNGKNLEWVDYADSYSVDLIEKMDAPRFCALVLEAAPRWLEVVLSARDKIVGRFGFNTQERNYGKPICLKRGSKFGPLVVQSVTPDRVICGDSDKHLAYRATFEVASLGQQGKFTTEVQFVDSLGRAYFALVKPFHRLIIPMLISAPFSRRNIQPLSGPSGK